MMKRNIYAGFKINSFRELRESVSKEKEEVTFAEFFYPCKRFISSLLENPSVADYDLDDVFTKRGITPNELIDKLRKFGLLKSNERISDKDGDHKAHYMIRYSVPKQDFEKKMHRLFGTLFESSIKNDNCIVECDGGACAGDAGGAGAMSAADSGAFDVPAFSSPVRRKIKHFRHRK